jgi:diguanylate cyclase (GGDEF)-like protein
VAKRITNKRTITAQGIEQETPERAPEDWAAVQESLALDSGLSLLLVEGTQPPALTVSNNNSICHALQSSPKHVQLCDPFCGAAHERAVDAGTVTHYRCHAGLHCFAMPVQIERDRQLAVIGGRALLTTADYRALAERFRAGELQELLSPELFRNVIFADEADIDHAALRVADAAREFAATSSPKGPKKRTDSKTAITQTSRSPIAEAETELAHARAELDRRRQFADSVHSFIERIDAADPSKTYDLILNESAALLKAERGSLFLYDEGADDLSIKAARGIPQALSEVGRIPLGEGIAGSVLREGRAVVTSDIASLGRMPAPRERRYKTGSFLSYPIRIGSRKIGVLNLADKAGGGVYDDVDLSIVESIGPQIALAVERAEWQEKANQFQLMSLTDPLTGLHNRRYLEARLFEEVSRSRRYNHPMSFMMIDIDDFKLYNDSNGHQAGDRALEITAHCLTSTVRKIDVASRYGGEEFSILMPQTSLPEASVIADRIRRKVAGTSYPQGKNQPLGAVTVSIGLSSFSPLLDSPEKIVRAADRALYHAKRQGKNRAYAYRDALTGNAARTP